MAAAYELAVCRARAGKFEAAIEGLRRILGRAQNQQVSVYQRLGECYMALGRLDEAIESFRQGLRLSPYSAELGFALAVAHDRDEDAAQAREALIQALSRDPRASTLAAANRVWVPPHEAHYYLGPGLSRRRGLVALGAALPALPGAGRRDVVDAAGACSLRGGAGRRDRRRGPRDQGLVHPRPAAPDRAHRALGRPAAGVSAQDARSAAARVDHAGAAQQAAEKGKAAAATTIATATAKPGVRVLVQEQSGAKLNDVRAVVACTEAIARKIPVPKPTGAPGTYATVEFNVIAR